MGLPPCMQSGGASRGDWRVGEGRGSAVENGWLGGNLSIASIVFQSATNCMR